MAGWLQLRWVQGVLGGVILCWLAAGFIDRGPISHAGITALFTGLAFVVFAGALETQRKELVQTKLAIERQFVDNFFFHTLKNHDLIVSEAEYVGACGNRAYGVFMAICQERANRECTALSEIVPQELQSNSHLRRLIYNLEPVTQLLPKDAVHAKQYLNLLSASLSDYELTFLAAYAEYDLMCGRDKLSNLVEMLTKTREIPAVDPGNFFLTPSSAESSKL